jgi:hypothetical protein
MAKPQGYRVLTRTEAERLQFHNLKRLMNKVRACIGFLENTQVDLEDGDGLSTFLYITEAQQELARHKEYFEILRDVSRNHPHKDSPKLRKEK